MGREGGRAGGGGERRGRRGLKSLSGLPHPVHTRSWPIWQIEGHLYL